MRSAVEHHKNLAQTLRHITGLLERQALVNRLVAKQDTPRHDLVQGLVEKQHLVELEMTLNRLHPADAAFVLESLPLEQRLSAWNLIQAERRGAILLELAGAVRESLLATLPRAEVLGAAAQLDSGELAELVPDLPQELVPEVLARLDTRDRAELHSTLSFPEGSVGALMERDSVIVRDDVTLETATRYLRRLGRLPAHTTQLFVVDREGALKGLLPLNQLLLSPGETRVAAVMTADPVYFYTDDPARDAAESFERYDLISAPVLNLHEQVVGRITVDAVLDYVKEDSFKQSLNQVGLSEDEDLFAPSWQSSRNRWPWLALNLMTAFIASRVIGVFEDTIAQLVALAALMPIVASIGGNTGNQTVALVIRGLALKQIQPGNLRFLLLKEAGVGLTNGAIWGAAMGFFVLLLYRQPALAAVMAAAMLLNLLVAALAGVFCPLLLQRLGRDPVMGSSVMLTAITDSMGFLIFLGLAALFLT